MPSCNSFQRVLDVHSVIYLKKDTTMNDILHAKNNRLLSNRTKNGFFMFTELPESRHIGLIL